MKVEVAVQQVLYVHLKKEKGLICTVLQVGNGNRNGEILSMGEVEKQSEPCESDISSELLREVLRQQFPKWREGQEQWAKADKIS